VSTTSARLSPALERDESNRPFPLTPKRQCVWACSCSQLSRTGSSHPGSQATGKDDGKLASAWMDRESREMLGRLVGLVEFGVRADRPGPFLLSGMGDESVMISGEALSILETLQGRLASSALASGGPNRTFVGDLVVEACRLARDRGPDAGISWLDEALTKQITPWTIITGVLGHFPAAPMRVGRTMLYPVLPPDIAAGLGDPRFLEVHIDRPVLVAMVDARDRESAKRRANDLFDEARSVLALAGSAQRWRTPVITIHESGPVSSSGTAESFLLHIRGALDQSHIRGLEAAAERAPEDRNDWENRCLAACRWYRKASTTDWPSEALAASMTVLECLFVEGRQIHNKGVAIAEKVAPNWRLPDFGAESAMHDWIVEMYRRRNEAVHSGAHYLKDVEVDRLLALTQYAVRWGAWHLDPDHDHGERDGPCTSFAEATSSERPL